MFITDNTCSNDKDLLFNSLSCELIDNKLYQSIYQSKIKNKSYYHNLLVDIVKYLIDNYFNFKTLTEFNNNLKILDQKINILKFYDFNINYNNLIYSTLNDERKYSKNIYKILLDDILENNTESSLKIIDEMYDINNVFIFTNIISNIIIDYFEPYKINNLISYINKFKLIKLKNNFYNILLTYYILILQTKIIDKYKVNKLLTNNENYWEWFDIHMENLPIYDDYIVKNKMINKFELIKLSDTLIYNYNLSYDILKFSFQQFIINKKKYKFKL